MEKYRDVLMFVCGLIVGLTVAYSFPRETAKGKVPTIAVESLESNPRAKVLGVEDKSSGDDTEIVECPAAMNRRLDRRASYIPWPGWPGMCMRIPKP